MFEVIEQRLAALTRQDRLGDEQKNDGKRKSSNDPFHINAMTIPNLRA
jgi:hypothetical protein